MSLDISLNATRPLTVYSANITHNLCRMAHEAGVYDCLWRGPENGYTHATRLVEPLSSAIAIMRDEPNRFKRFDDPSGWGTYDAFLPWLERLLAACLENPEAEIETSR